MESELKRVTAQKTTVNKQQILAEVGTSVVPRQRPKGNVSSQNLPLVLPSSPSPRNMIASPSPQSLQDNESYFETSDKSNNISVQNSAPKPKTFAIVLQNDAKTSIKSSENENMFEAKFVDSFSGTTNLPQMPPPPPSISKKEVVSPTSPIHQQLLNTPKVDNRLSGGHRRNMSDTSAFNKYRYFLVHFSYVCEVFESLHKNFHSNMKQIMGIAH